MGVAPGQVRILESGVRLPAMDAYRVRFWILDFGPDFRLGLGLGLRLGLGLGLGLGWVQLGVVVRVVRVLSAF